MVQSRITRPRVILGIATLLGCFSAFQASQFVRFFSERDTPFWILAGLNFGYWYTWALLAPIVLLLASRFPLDRERWMRSLPVHLVAVLVLAARWDSKAWDFQDGVFVHGSDVLSWVADDGARRGDGAFVLTAHSTPAFAATRLAVPADAAPDLIAGLAALGVPEPAEVLRVQRWTFAKPVGPREPAFFLEDGLGLCGDGWGRSRVEGAWLSGTLLGEALG